ncbi:unnamed protein product [Gadus morhua 'NCC']
MLVQTHISSLKSPIRTECCNPLSLLKVKEEEEEEEEEEEHLMTPHGSRHHEARDTYTTSEREEEGDEEEDPRTEEKVRHTERSLARPTVDLGPHHMQLVLLLTAE